MVHFVHILFLLSLITVACRAMDEGQDQDQDQGPDENGQQILRRGDDGGRERGGRGGGGGGEGGGRGRGRGDDDNNDMDMDMDMDMGVDDDDRWHLIPRYGQCRLIRPTVIPYHPSPLGSYGGGGGDHNRPYGGGGGGGGGGRGDKRDDYNRPYESGTSRPYGGGGGHRPGGNQSELILHEFRLFQGAYDTSFASAAAHCASLKTHGNGVGQLAAVNSSNINALSSALGRHTNPDQPDHAYIGSWNGDNYGNSCLALFAAGAIAGKS